MLLPDTSGEQARQVAEHLRFHIERTEIPRVGHVTICLGVYKKFPPNEAIKEGVKRADDAMYATKICRQESWPKSRGIISPGLFRRLRRA